MLNKNITYILILVAVFTQSCEKFLEEDFRSGNPTDEFYTTVDGLEALVAASYVTNRIWYGQEEGLDFTEIGTDYYTYGNQHPEQQMVSYGTALDGERGRIITVYVELYKGVNATNEALAYLNDPEHPMDENTKLLRRAEMRFMRAFYYWHLVEMFGDIAMPLDYTKAPITTATKSSVYEVYTQIFTDLNESIRLFEDNAPTANTTADKWGRVNLDACYAFRARLALNIASYIESGEGAANKFGFVNGLPLTGEGSSAKTSNVFFTQAKADADRFITGASAGAYGFYDSYDEMWLLANNSTNKHVEAIWGVNFSRELTATMGIPESGDFAIYDPYYTGGQKPWSDREGGDTRHLMYGMQYDIMPGMERDMENGRPFRRYIPTKYFVDLFTENDARWEGQYKTVWLANGDTTRNKPAAGSDSYNSYPRWSDFELPTGFTIPTDYPEVDLNGNPTGKYYVYWHGDTSIVMTKEDIPDDRVVKQTNGNYYLWVDEGVLTWDLSLIYNLGGTGPAQINEPGTVNRNNMYELHKFYDNERLAYNGDGSQRGIRDPYVFRLSEMYMIAAEAAQRGGLGDPRTYLEELASHRVINGATAAELVDANIAVSANGALDEYYFLDERAREFVGEHLRWFDVKRMFNRADWVTYMQERNPDASDNIEQFHYFRPFPNVQLESISNKDEFKQNTGYTE